MAEQSGLAGVGSGWALTVLIRPAQLPTEAQTSLIFKEGILLSSITLQSSHLIIFKLCSVTFRVSERCILDFERV